MLPIKDSKQWQKTSASRSAGASVVIPVQYCDCQRGCFGTKASDIGVGLPILPVGVLENCTRAMVKTKLAAHPAGSHISYFSNDDAIRETAAHEASHAVHIVQHRDNSIMQAGEARGAYLGNGLNGLYDNYLQDSLNELETK